MYFWIDKIVIGNELGQLEDDQTTRRHYMTLCVCYVAVLVTALCSWIAFSGINNWYGRLIKDKPLYILEGFVTSQLVTLNEREEPIGDLSGIPLEKFNGYTGASCVDSSNYTMTRRALRAQLYKMPEEVVDDILNGAVMPNTNTKNCYQNTVSEIDEKGTQHTFVAFWTSEYIKRDDTYSVCVLISGLGFTTAESIFEWITVNKSEILGYRIYDCGIFRCSEEPIIKITQTRTPIFKRHFLDLEHHLKLQTFMIQKACLQAVQLLNDRIGGAHLSKYALKILGGDMNVPVSDAWKLRIPEDTNSRETVI